MGCKMSSWSERIIFLMQETFSTNGNAGKRNTKTPAKTYTWTEPDTCWTWNSVRARQTCVTQQTQYQPCVAKQSRLLHFCGLFYYKTKGPRMTLWLSTRLLFMIVQLVILFFYAEFGIIFLIPMILFLFLKKLLYPIKVFTQRLALVLVTNYKLISCIAKQNKKQKTKIQ